MNRWVMTFLLVLGLGLPATAEDYTVKHKVVFPSGKASVVHVNPYPTSRRAASVWSSDSCWRGCTSSCAWAMEACVTTTDADLCRPTADACARSCQRSCRVGGGPLLPDFLDW